MPKHPPPPQQMGWTFDADNPTFVRSEPTPKPGRGIITGYQVQAYLHSRTVLCPSCTGLIPLSPNWRLSPDYSIRLLPDINRGIVDFEVVAKRDESYGTVKKAIAVCPLCGTTTPKGYISSEAQARADGRNWDEVNQLLPPRTSQHPEPPPPHLKDLFVGKGAEGRLGSVEYCRVWRNYYPVYRAGKPPKQGKSPGRYYIVPGTVKWDSFKERQRLLSHKGISDPYLYTAPESAWLFDESYEDDPDSLVPGVADPNARRWEITEVERKVSFPPLPFEVR